MPYLDNLGLSHLWDIIKSKLALKANSSDVYTKTQIDNKGYITKSVNNLDNYTTTTALNTALNNKADKSTTYTKTEVDTALSSKANTSAIPTKVSDLTNDSAFITKSVSNLNNYYTKTSIDTSLSSKANTSDLANKQDKLVSGTSIKTVNNTTLLGSGNINVSYSLPTASSSTKGGIKVGSGLSINDGVLSVSGGITYEVLETL